MTTITIAIPTYNRKNTLHEGLLRLIELKKEIPHLVILVSDNASIDGTKEMVETIILQEDVRYLRSEVNLGIAGNQRAIFNVCDTDYLWIISDDDLIDLLNAKQLLNIIQKTDYCLVATNYSSFSSNDSFGQNIIGHITSNEYDRALDLINQPSVGHISAFIYNVTDLKNVMNDAFKHTDISYYNKGRGLYQDIGIRICASSKKKSFYYGHPCIYARIPNIIDYDKLEHLCVNVLKAFRFYETSKLVSREDFLYRKDLVRSLLPRGIVADSHRYTAKKLYLYKQYLIAEFQDERILLFLFHFFLNSFGALISRFLSFMYHLMNPNVVKKKIIFKKY